MKQQKVDELVTSVEAFHAELQACRAELEACKGITCARPLAKCQASIAAFCKAHKELPGELKQELEAFRQMVKQKR